MIFIVRGMRVVVDRDLAELYGVPTKALNQAVKRNADRFPEGFMFRLSDRELAELVTICDRFANLKHSRQTPMAFTEYGVAMLSSVLRSPRAVRVNIEIVQTFISFKKWSLASEELAKKITSLERRSRRHSSQISGLIEALNRLIDADAQVSLPRIGFQP